MNYSRVLFLIFIFCSVQVSAQHHNTSIHTKSEIKALTTGQLNGYLKGEGMGLAKAAELNHYPGPMHVLELSDELKLTDEQIFHTKNFISEVKQEAIQLGNQIVEKEKELDILFKNGNPNESAQSLILEIAKLKGELRFVHINAHIKQKEILTSEQIKLYNKLRGY